MDADQFLRNKMAEQGFELTPDEARQAGSTADKFLEQCALSLRENPDMIEVYEQALVDDDVLEDLWADSKAMGVDVPLEKMKKLIYLLKKGSEIAREQGMC